MRKGLCEGLAGSWGWCEWGFLIFKFSVVNSTFGVSVRLSVMNNWCFGVICQLRFELELRDAWNISG